ncbi:MAG: hypothetical protein ACREML_10830, partial [Vulcanimicrobiaceae bacterium]
MIDDATTPTPLRPALTRALVDAWSMTSLDQHTGRPEVGPWLRGWIEDDEPHTLVVWRTYLPVRAEGGEASMTEVEKFFEAASPHVSEVLETETWRVVEWLTKRAAEVLKVKAPTAERPSSIPLKAEDIIAFPLSPAGDCLHRYQLSDLANTADKRLVERLKHDCAGETLIVDARLGGLTNGLLSGESDALPPTADDGGEWLPPANGVPVVGFQIQPPVRAETATATRQTYGFATRRTDEGDDIEILQVETVVTEESRAASVHPQTLAEHQSWTEQRALAIAEGVGLTGDHK